MEFLHTMMRVKDLDKSVDFFTNTLGLSETSRYDCEKGRFTNVFIGVTKGGKEIELTYNWDNEDNYSIGRAVGHIALGVDNIYEYCDMLISKGVIINRPPRDGYMAFFKSPDGVSIELLQKGEKLIPIEPWASMENNGTW